MLAHYWHFHVASSQVTVDYYYDWFTTFQGPQESAPLYWQGMSFLQRKHFRHKYRQRHEMENAHEAVSSPLCAVGLNTSMPVLLSHRRHFHCKTSMIFPHSFLLLRFFCFHAKVVSRLLLSLRCACGRPRQMACLSRPPLSLSRYTGGFWYIYLSFLFSYT